MLVHGLNPYGFAHFTRTTENNVDLNRNFIDRTAGAAPANPHYETLHDDLMIQAVDRRGERAGRCGDGRLHRASTAATRCSTPWRAASTVHPDGLMYGGKDREWSNRTLETIVQETLCGAEKVAFIDWHTGIGDYGKPFFLCFNEAGGALFANVPATGGARRMSTACARTAWSGRTTPAWSSMACSASSAIAQMCGAVIEFGTRGVGMRRVLRLDQWLRRQNGLDPDVRAGLQADMMDAFCPFDGQWRKDTLDGGSEAHGPGDRLAHGTSAGHSGDATGHDAKITPLGGRSRDPTATTMKLDNQGARSRAMRWRLIDAGGNGSERQLQLRRLCAA